MNEQQVRAQYTREFKLEAVRQVRSGQSISFVARVLGVPKASLGHVPRRGVSPQPGQAEIHGTQRVTADSRVGKVSLKVCNPSSCM
jgi:transposase-like protein